MSVSIIYGLHFADENLNLMTKEEREGGVLQKLILRLLTDLGEHPLLFHIDFLFSSSGVWNRKWEIKCGKDND